MPPKQIRFIDRELCTLFSSNAFLRISTVEDFKALKPFHQGIEINGHKIYLSEKGIASLDQISAKIFTSPEISGDVNFSDTYNQVSKTYETWVQNDSKPDAGVFVDDVIYSLKSQVKKYNFLVQIEGLDLKDFDSHTLGSFTIQRANKEFLDALDLQKISVKDTIYKEFKNGFWLIGSAQGTASVALEKFKLHTLLRIGIIAIYSSTLFESVFSRTRVLALIDPQEGYNTTHTLQWENSGENVSFSLSWGTRNPLTLTHEDFVYFTENCFLNQLCTSLESKEKSEIEEAIFRSVYWFSDAYRDNTPTMRFIKLWTSAECFFAIGEEAITESNAMGIATLLVFSGYGIKKPENYAALKSRIKKFYALRSKAVHRAEFSHITNSDINELSQWIAWTIISVTSLIPKGYKNLREIREQILRLDSSIKSESPEM